MNAASEVEVKRLISTLRDPACAPAQRALAATSLAAALAATGVDELPPGAAPPHFDNPNVRMFDYGVPHENATRWDGKSTRTGTITYVDDERIEQYIGQQHWIVYRPGDLDLPGFVVGDQVRITRRAGAVAIEAVANNRLSKAVPVDAPVLRSGMVVFRTSEMTAEEVATSAQTVADRYAARLTEDGDCFVLTFARGAQLMIFPCGFGSAGAIEELASEPFTAALRLEVVVPSNLADAALEAECALAYGAAFVATSAEAVAIDDTGAIFSAEQLYELAVRDESRAAHFSLAAAAAQRAFPAPAMWLSDRGGVCDELAVVSSRAWRADFAAAFLNRALGAFADAMQRTQDPIIPAEGVMYSEGERGEPGALVRLISLSYSTVTVDVSFLDLTAGNGETRRYAEARQDLDALLGGPIQSAIVIVFGNAADETDSDDFALEMRRADVLATTLAAAFARRGNAVGIDASGALYSAEDLTELALQRRGKAASWTGRVAALRQNSDLAD